MHQSSRCESHDHESWRETAGRIAALIAAVATVSALHYAVQPTQILWHEVFRHLYYVPIIAGAYWFGVAGGLGTAAAVAVAYVPHIRMAWAADSAFAISQYAEIVVFMVIALVIGALAASQQALTARYRDSARSLETANRDLRESQERLRRADRLSAVGEVAAGLAHEIRNPLAGVKGACEIIAARVSAGTPEAEFAAIANRELATMDALISDFLTFARPRDPQMRPDHVPAVIERTFTLLRADADRARVALRLEAEATVQPAMIDAEQMSQVFVNVVLNAIQASPPGAPVLIRVTGAAGQVQIDVVDLGAGIAPEHAARIFDPFFTTKTRGTGLGLAISSRIVAAHGGSIEVLARAGAETTFRIRVPVSRTDAVRQLVHTT